MESTQGPPERVASIDIGTNTILLLIAEVQKGKLHPLLERETVVRLGQGLQRSGSLLEEAMQRGYQTLSDDLGLCRAYGVQKIYAAGTSALREAANASDFLEAIKGKLGLSIDVISGEEEARLSYLAVVKDLEDREGPLRVIDVGGGSTEFVFGRGNKVIRWVSLPIGLVRLTERFLLSDPVRDEEWQEMVNEIRRRLAPLPRPAGSALLVSVGGTGTTLASVQQGLREFDPRNIHHFVLEREALGRLIDLFRSRTLEGRKGIPGLPPARADVILAGATILYLGMEELNCPSVLISCHGVRYGLLYEKLSGGPSVA